MGTDTSGAHTHHEHTITVLVAGDPNVDDALRAPGGDLEVVDHVGTGNDAINVVLTELPDVLLLDVRIEDADARAVCRQVREWAPATRVIAITPLDDERAYTTVVAGASGALPLDAGDDATVRTVRAIARRESVLLPRMAGRLMHDLDAWGRRAADPINPPPTLTATEREVLTRISEGVDPSDIAQVHSVTSHLVNLHAGFAVAKLHRYVLGNERIAARAQPTEG